MKLPFTFKVPFTFKLGAVKGLFARLNPAGLLAKLKRKKKGEGDEDEAGGGADMFADLGDLDELDAAAAERQREKDEADEADYNDPDSERYSTDKQENLDDLMSGDGEEDENGAKSDSSSASAAAATQSAEMDLAALQAMPDFGGEDGEEQEEGEEDAAKAKKKKKLLFIAGGGVAAAVLIGAGMWLVLSGDGGDTADQAEGAKTKGGVVLSLDNVPMVEREPEVPVGQPLGAVPADAASGAPAGGLTPPAPAAPGAPAAAGAPAPSRPLSPEESELVQLGLNVAQEPGAGVVVPSSTQTSFARVLRAAKGQALTPAPIASLTEPSDLGALPKIAEDGLTPFDGYAKPDPEVDSAKPKVAVVITGLGLSRPATEAAIAALPENVTLALDVYARGLDFWVAKAREDGHEVLLTLPMEAADFPFSDPGPDTLLVLTPPQDNAKKMTAMLARTSGYFGVLADQGGKFLSVEEQVKAVVQVLKDRGLMLVDGGAEGSLAGRVALKADIPWAAVEIALDQEAGKEALDAQLAAFEALAEKRAISIARVTATPLTLTRLPEWIKGLEQKGLALVPLSSLAKKQIVK